MFLKQYHWILGKHLGLSAPLECFRIPKQFVLLIQSVVQCEAGDGLLPGVALLLDEELWLRLYFWHPMDDVFVDPILVRLVLKVGSYAILELGEHINLAEAFEHKLDLTVIELHAVAFDLLLEVVELNGVLARSVMDLIILLTWVGVIRDSVGVVLDLLLVETSFDSSPHLVHSSLLALDLALLRLGFLVEESLLVVEDFFEQVNLLVQR